MKKLKRINEAKEKESEARNISEVKILGFDNLKFLIIAAMAIKFRETVGNS